MDFETVKLKCVTFVCLFVLQWAGVPCDGTTDFWMSHDGSYIEVGQKNVKGHIWEKVIHVYMDVRV